MLIVNPNAGRRLGEKIAKQVFGWFNDSGFKCTLFLTQKRGGGTELVLKHSSDFDTIVCIGGDGTLNEVINGIIKSGSNIPLGYIPAGSTNDFAGSLNISRNPETAVKNIINGQPVKIDAGKFGDRYFSYVASFGMFTKASYATPQNMKNTLGRLSYFIEGAKEITNIRAEQLLIEADEQKFEGKYIFGAISNSKSIGGLVKYDSSTVDFSDGMLEMMLIKKTDSIVNLAKVLHCLKNKNYNNPYIDFYRAKQFKIITDDNLGWSLDGEFASGTNKFQISCAHQKINLICPCD